MRGTVLAAMGFVVTVLALSGSAGGARAATGSPIADTALQYVGTHGGQCWTFMQQVVGEATGRRVGYDYRQGYFEAGAVEVSASDAIAGDIIQIASDANSGPGASYPGLHTAIILENLGGGVFNAVDSNQNWDEMVRLRPNYDPYASAARYGLDVHIYRVPGGSAGDIPVSAAVSSGGGARVATDSGCLNLRSSASLDGGRISCLPNGTAVTVTGEAVAADGYSWVPVETALGSGWVAANYLAGDTTPAAAAAEPEPVAVEAPADPAPVAAVAAAVPVNWIHVDSTPGCLRLRSGGTIDSSIVDCLAAGTAVTLISDASVPSGGYVFVNVRTEHGGVGWVASEHLVE